MTDLTSIRNLREVGNALSNLRPKAVWGVIGNELTWVDDLQTEPPISEIQTEVTRLEEVEPIRLLRQKRNALLASTDWRDLPSYAGTKQAEWRVYRQALRDITSGLDTADKVTAATFPSQPS